MKRYSAGLIPWTSGEDGSGADPARGEHHGGSETQERCATRPRHCHGLQHTTKTRRDRRDSPGFAETRMKTSIWIYLRQLTLHPSRNGARRARLHFSKRANSLTNCFNYLSPPNLVFVMWKLLQFPPRRCSKRASTAVRHCCFPRLPHARCLRDIFM